MTEEIHGLEIGKKLRARREQQGMSAYDLAKRCDLTEARLMAIEEGYVTPAISALLRFARVLGVGVGYFFQEAETRKPVEVVRSGARLKIAHEDHEGSGEGLHYDYETLVVNFPGAVMKPFHVEIGVFDDPKLEAASHRGQEFIFVLEGELEWRSDAETHRLSTGDSIYFDGEIPHKIVGVGTKNPRVISVIYEPPEG
jgi:transcriptional regulator with XRE-family HTH domain